MKKLKFQQVIFDLDGTLLNSEEHVFETLQRIIEKIRGSRPTKEQILEKFSANPVELYENFSLSGPDLQRAKELWVEYSAQSTRSVGLFEGITSGLKGLKEAGANIHIWTARDRGSATKFLKEQEIIHLFDNFYFGDDDYPKPSPRGLRELTEDAPAENCVVLGDHDVDMIGAKEACYQAYGANWSLFSCEKELHRGGADEVFDCPFKAFEFLYLNH